MKTSKKIRIIALLTVLIVAVSALGASAAEKLDQNMSGADMTFGERFEYALQGTATGMLMVFAVLGLLWGIVTLSKLFLYDLPNKKAEKKKKKRASALTSSDVVSAPEIVPEEMSESYEDEGEIAAVITAAIAAMIESGDYKNEFAGGFRVVSFRRANGGKAWNSK